ncbi:MAG: hydroxymethylglutaryl-CoA lyase [Actinomycetota bacterium]
MRYPRTVRIREVGPRDGIQGERVQVPTEKKIELIDALSAAGLSSIEAAAFVSPAAVPQMADALQVFQGIARRAGVVYSALVPNRRGAEMAVDAGADSLQVFVAATDSYNLRNVRRTVRESMTSVADVASVARAAEVPLEATISTAFGCPYEGDVPPARVVEVSRWVLEEGVSTISYGDTTGMGTPRRVADVLDALRAELPEVIPNMHFHDTRGTGLANVLLALELGVEYFDASIGGMGGSPFASGATGNIATEDLIHMLEDMGVSTGVDLDLLLDAAAVAQRLIGGELPSKLLKAGPRRSALGPVARAD